MSNKKSKRIGIQFLSFILLVGCSSYPETPEEVVEDFITYLSNAECEKAMEL